MRKTFLFMAVIIFNLPTLAQLKPDSSKHPVYNYYLQGITAFNRHDLPAFLQQFDDEIHMFTHAGWLRNKEQVAKRFDEIFRQFPNIKMVIGTLNVRQVNETTTLVDFSVRTFPKGSGPAFQTVGSGVYVKKNGR